MTRAVVLGGGAWGTALAVHLARIGRDVTLWCRTEEAASRLVAERCNTRYLPGVSLPDELAVTHDLHCLADAKVVIAAVPSAATAEVARAAAGACPDDVTWVSATKGLEPGTCRRLSQVALEAFQGRAQVAALSGPSFAVEVSAGQPTAVVVASANLGVAREVQALVSGPTFRAYASTDLVGVEMAGALKNVIAIAAGALSGLSLGHDPLAALITRGLHEMTQLSVALGAQPQTLAGLAGLGDLVLTCTGGPSRNRRLGILIAQRVPVPEALARLGHVAEGVETTERALSLAAERGVEMPIAAAVRDVLQGTVPVEEAIRRLMTRNLKDEWS